MSESFTTIQFPPSAHLGSSDRDEHRPPAGPSPLKSGEIGFVEGIHGVTSGHVHDIAEPTSPLPARHPADRDLRRSFSRPSQAVNDTRTVHEFASHSFSITKNLFGRLTSKKVPSIDGLQLTSLVLFAVQLIALGGTIALWVFATEKAKATLASRLYENMMGSLTVFIHVVFVIFVVGQLLLLERRISRLRDERYLNLHPGHALPRHSHSLSSSNTITSAAPWNRSPLPTYATVLAQSGVSTGDVEDNLIAIPPPPAYGNVRGSTLLDSARRD